MFFITHCVCSYNLKLNEKFIIDSIPQQYTLEIHISMKHLHISSYSYTLSLLDINPILSRILLLLPVSATSQPTPSSLLAPSVPCS
jgi:hypothetical protein